MNVLIVEDEIVAANRLKIMIQEFDPEIKIAAILNSVLETANYLNDHQPDLIFLDIQLSDGICFELFEKLKLELPVVFTTAYDEYMQQAFKVNSIDYLLKPIRKGDLGASITKYKRYHNAVPDQEMLDQLFANYISEKKAYKCRFMVKSGRSFISIDVNDVAYIVAQNKLNYLVTTNGKRFAVDFTQDQLELTLDPREFLKISRNYIISNKCIQKVEPYFNNRMIVEVKPSSNEDILVSRNYQKAFKNWMEL